MDNSTRPVKENIKKALEKAISYSKYRDLVKNLAETNSNTGPIQTDALVNYTQLNNRRMKRWDKTLKVSEEYRSQIQNCESETTWLVLTESWCGDASPSLPVMNKIADLNSKLNFKIVLRDENIDLMNSFLTNGAQSIPKLVALDSKTHKVLGEWGPRPSTATKMVNDYKTEHGKLSAEFKEDLQVWYNKDKGQTILDDLVKLLTLK